MHIMPTSKSLAFALKLPCIAKQSCPAEPQAICSASLPAVGGIWVDENGLATIPWCRRRLDFPTLVPNL